MAVNCQAQYFYRSGVTSLSPPFAVLCWVYGGGDYRTFFVLDGEHDTYGDYYLFGTGGNDNLEGHSDTPILLARAATSNYFPAAAPGTLSANTWHHCAALVTHTNRRRVFLDGVGGTTIVNDQPANPTSISVGSHVYAGSRIWNQVTEGPIAEVSLYDPTPWGSTDTQRRMFFENVVLPVMQQGWSHPTMFAGLQGYWPFGGLYGENSHDQSENSLHLTAYTTL